jgi:hypothetical protein
VEIAMKKITKDFVIIDEEIIFVANFKHVKL